MGIFIEAFQNRGSSHTITFKNAAGGTIALTAGDKVRIKIGRAGETPIKDIVSGTQLSGGTQVTATNPATLTIRGPDFTVADILPGIYDLEACVVDHGDSDFIKHGELGVFSLINVPTGGIT
jgi:hypothetical protein